MDERQTQIKEGAGLDESRLNQDFIELLRKWSTPVLLVLAIVAFSYYGVQQWQKLKVAKVNDAFTALESVRASGVALPSQYILVAQSHSGIRSVALMANLDAADACMQAVLSGIMPGFIAQQDGTIVFPDGSPIGEDENVQTKVTDDDRTSLLTQAQTLYQGVLTEAEKDDGTLLLAVSASFGLASIAETQADFEAAKGILENTAVLAERGGFVSHATIARARIDSLGDLETRPILYETSALPVIEEPEIAPPLIPQPMDAGEGDPTGEPVLGPTAPGDPVGDPIADPAQGGAGDPNSGEAGDPTTGEGGGEETTGEGGGEETTGEGGGEAGGGETGGEGGGEEGGGEKSGEGGGGSPTP